MLGGVIELPNASQKIKKVGESYEAKIN